VEIFFFVFCQLSIYGRKMYFDILVFFQLPLYVWRQSSSSKMDKEENLSLPNCVTLCSRGVIDLIFCCLSIHNKKLAHIARVLIWPMFCFAQMLISLAKKKQFIMKQCQSCGWRLRRNQKRLIEGV
jgi:hypothetical protein